MTKFTITNKSLKGPLSIAASIAPSSSTLPILENIYFSDGKLIASDSQAQISIYCAVQGNFTAPADKLKKITSAFADDSELTFEIKGDKLIVKSGRSKLTVPITDAVGFPIPQLVGDPMHITLKQEDIKFHLQNVMHAAGNNDVAMWKNTILFRNDKKLLIGATTGFEAAISEQDVGLSPFEFALPVKAANQLAKLLKDGDMAVAIYKNKVVFNLAGIEFIAPVFDGQYPDIVKIVPKQGTPIVFERDLFIATSDKAAINASEKFGGATIRLHGAEMEIECRDFGADSMDALDIDYAGADLEKTYNVFQLRKAVSAIRSEKVTMYVDDRAALFCSDDGMQCNVVAGMRI